MRSYNLSSASSKQVGLRLRALLRHPFKVAKQRAYIEKWNYVDRVCGQSVVLPVAEPPSTAVLHRCALHIHAFYGDIFAEIIDSLGFVTARDIHIEVTASGDVNLDFAEALLRAKGCRSFRLRAVPNIGRDLGPLFTECRELFVDFDYVGHVHTKRSTTSSFGDKWRRYLVDATVGSDDAVFRQISYFEENARCGVLYPQNFSAARGATYSRANDGRVDEILKSCNSSWKAIRADFPAGSMCWMRTEAFRSSVNLLPPLASYEPEKGQLDGTTAHALERCLSMIPINAGYDAISFTF